MQWRDTTTIPAFSMLLRPVNASLDNLRLDGGDPATLKLTATADNGVAIEHDGTLRVTPLSIDGGFKLSGAKPQAFLPYFAHLLAVDVESAGLDLQGRYQVVANAQTQQNDVSLTELRFTARDALVRERSPTGTKPAPARGEWLRIATICVDASSIDLAKQVAAIDSVSLRDARVAVNRARDGKVNWASFSAARPVTPQREGITRPEADPAPPPWTWQVKRVSLAKLSGQFEDRTPTEPIAIAAGPIELTATGLSSNLASPVQIALKSGINKTGAVDLRGQLIIEPLSAALNVDLTALKITPFQPYFEQFLNLVVASGSITTRGAIGLVTVPGAGLRAGFQGDVAIATFASADRVNATDLLKWKSLFLSEVKFASEPLVVDVRDVALNDFLPKSFSRLTAD